MMIIFLMRFQKNVILTGKYPPQRNGFIIFNTQFLLLNRAIETLLCDNYKLFLIGNKHGTGDFKKISIWG